MLCEKNQVRADRLNLFGYRAIKAFDQRKNCDNRADPDNDTKRSEERTQAMGSKRLQRE
jgi:hypothetical protein